MNVGVILLGSNIYISFLVSISACINFSVCHGIQDFPTNFSWFFFTIGIDCILFTNRIHALKKITLNFLRIRQKDFDSKSIDSFFNFITAKQYFWFPFLMKCPKRELKNTLEIRRSQFFYKLWDFSIVLVSFRFL